MKGDVLGWLSSKKTAATHLSRRRHVAAPETSIGVLEKSFKTMYQDIQVLRDLAEGRVKSISPDQLAGVLKPLAKSLTAERALKEIQRWNEIFDDVFVGLDSFNLQLENEIPFSTSDLALSIDSARIALDSLAQRLLRTKTAA